MSTQRREEGTVSEYTETEVLVVGAGPTGLMLSGLLARAGVRPRLIDRRDSTPSKAVHSRSPLARWRRSTTLASCSRLWRADGR